MRVSLAKRVAFIFMAGGLCVNFYAHAGPHGEDAGSVQGVVVSSPSFKGTTPEGQGALFPGVKTCFKIATSVFFLSMFLPSGVRGVEAGALSRQALGDVSEPTNQTALKGFLGENVKAPIAGSGLSFDRFLEEIGQREDVNALDKADLREKRRVGGKGRGGKGRSGKGRGKKGGRGNYKPHAKGSHHGRGKNDADAPVANGWLPFVTLGTVLWWARS
jgi:hypothetical protein